jgi:hypothetical protein
MIDGIAIKCRPFFLAANHAGTQRRQTVCQPQRLAGAAPAEGLRPWRPQGAERRPESGRDYSYATGHHAQELELKFADVGFSSNQAQQDEPIENLAKRVI